MQPERWSAPHGSARTLYANTWCPSRPETQLYRRGTSQQLQLAHLGDLAQERAVLRADQEPRITYFVDAQLVPNGSCAVGQSYLAAQHQQPPTPHSRPGVISHLWCKHVLEEDPPQRLVAVK